MSSWSLCAWPSVTANCRLTIHCRLVCRWPKGPHRWHDVRDMRVWRHDILCNGACVCAFVWRRHKWVCVEPRYVRRGTDVREHNWIIFLSSQHELWYWIHSWSSQPKMSRYVSLPVFILIRPPDIVCRRTYILPVFLLSSFFLSSFFSPPDLRDRWTELNESRPHGRK